MRITKSSYKRHLNTAYQHVYIRCLIYLGRLYEKLLETENIHKETLVKLDSPEFYVVYTGTKSLPDVSILKLSDSFRAIPSNNSVEVIVKVVNAWYTEDNEILRQSRALREYSLFLYKVKEYLDMGMPLSDAIHKAVLYCADHDIMKDFLLENASEVENMFFVSKKRKVNRSKIKAVVSLRTAVLLYQERGNTDGICETISLPCETDD